jgi:hypothetical protein
MSSIDHLPMNGDPPEAAGVIATEETASVNDFIAGGAKCAVAAPRFGRGLLPTVART